MLAHYKMTHDSAGLDRAWKNDPAWLDGCFIASLVTGRLYLNVLGIGKRDRALTPFGNKGNDVMVDDLGGVRLDVPKLPGGEQQLFLDFLIMADKAAAHFTMPKNHDWSKTHDIMRLIHGYLKSNLYYPAGRSELEDLV